jgi:hypothetical protein
MFVEGADGYGTWDKPSPRLASARSSSGQPSPPRQAAGRDGGQDADTGFLDRGEDGLVRGDVYGEFALLEVDLDGLVEHGFG